MANPTEFTIEQQWHLYLKRVGISEDMIPEMQKKQLKQAFFAACGQLLLLMKEGMVEMDPEKGADILEDMIRQCATFWANEKMSQN